MVVDGVQYEVLQDMKSGIHDFCKSLFTEPRPKVDCWFLPSLRDFDKDNIEWIFTEEEFNKALLDCCGDKAPGLDGMTMAFLQSNWNTVKPDVMRMYSTFFSSQKFVSATFIGLILKKVNARI